MNDAYTQIYMRLDALRYGPALQRIPEGQWPAGAKAMAKSAVVPPREVWRSRDYLLLVYREGAYERLSVCRAALNASRDGWADGISWDDLMLLKRECGRGDAWAVEVYPDDRNIINVANMRHLFLLPEPPPYGWRNEATP